MTIPTRDELIERALASGVAISTAQGRADFALSEIRRAVAEELEALRKWIGPPDCDWPYALQEQHERIVVEIDARLAALRQTEQPPGAATVAEPQQSARKLTAGAAGSTPAPGATNIAAPALSDAETLERAAEIMERMGSPEATPDELRSDAAKLRAASAPKPVDVFEAFVAEWFEDEYVCGGPEERTTAEYARDWFGPLVEALENAAEGECEDPPSLDNWTCSGCWPCEAKKILSALRQRAQEASR